MTTKIPVPLTEHELEVLILALEDAHRQHRDEYGAEGCTEWARDLTNLMRKLRDV